MPSSFSVSAGMPASFSASAGMPPSFSFLGGDGVVVFVFVLDENAVGDFNGRDAWRDYAVFLAAP